MTNRKLLILLPALLVKTEDMCFLYWNYIDKILKRSISSFLREAQEIAFNILIILNKQQYHSKIIFYF